MAEMTKKRERLLSGDDGVLQTLRLMERLALRDAQNPQMIAKARELKGKTDAETVSNIFEFVRKNWKYKADPDREEHVTAPIHLLSNCYEKGGCRYVDCDDFSALLVSLLTAAGFKTAFRVLSWRLKNFTHVYVLVEIPGKGWTPLDAVLKSDGLFNEKERSAHIRTLDYPVGESMNTNNVNAATVNDRMPVRVGGGEYIDNYDALMDSTLRGDGVVGLVTGAIGGAAKNVATGVCEELAKEEIKKYKVHVMLGFAATALVSSGLTYLVVKHWK